MKIIRLGDVKASEINDSRLFVGKVSFKNVLDRKDSKSYWVFHASFSPGNRSVVHTHNTDQLLYFTEGKGLVGTGTEEHEVESGTLVFIPAGQRHYHGATSATSCSHLAILLEGPGGPDKK